MNESEQNKPTVLGQRNRFPVLRVLAVAIMLCVLVLCGVAMCHAVLVQGDAVTVTAIDPFAEDMSCFRYYGAALGWYHFKFTLLTLPEHMALNCFTLTIAGVVASCLWRVSDG
jgi:hypothetical protein